MSESGLSYMSESGHLLMSETEHAFMSESEYLFMFYVTEIKKKQNFHGFGVKMVRIKYYEFVLQKKKKYYELIMNLP